VSWGVTSLSTKETLCWTCERACGGKGCSWAAHADPVDGWTAVEARITTNEGCEESYLVQACPLYSIDRRLIGKTCQMCKQWKRCKRRGHVCSNFQPTDIKVSEMLRRIEAGDLY